MKKGRKEERTNGIKGTNIIKETIKLQKKKGITDERKKGKTE